MTRPTCQDWLLPYFADLVDARLVSPLPDGRRDELAKAIRWRQGKGTLATMDSVAESIGQTVAVVQEGWSRVVTTPRIGQPLRPAVSYGYSREPEAANPGNAARHPDLPAAIIDMRCPSRALASDPDNPGAQTITFEGTSHIWRQGSWHGAPCFPGSYEDVSRRTVDIRTPNWRVGHAHPRRVLAFLPPASGFFPPDAPRVTWNAVPSPAYLDLIEVDDSVPGVIIHRNRTLATGAFVPVAIRNNVDLDAAASPAEWRFEGIVFERRVFTATARLGFARCAARTISTTLAEMDQPAIDIADSLVNRIIAHSGLVRLVGVTVMRRLAARAVEASECLFQALITALTNTSDPPPQGGCLRYSRIEPEQQQGDMRYFEVTREAAAMVETAFGERHCGVLLPASHDDVLTG